MGSSGKIFKSIRVLSLSPFAEGVFRENCEKYHGTFLNFIRRGSENFSEKGGSGGSSGKMSKSIMVFFCSVIRRGGWVSGEFDFEKSAYVPSKKYLHPPWEWTQV